MRREDNLKTPKFHQTLHVVYYITKYGFPMNYDGSRGDIFGKLRIKANTKLTNKDKEPINSDIGCRISEENIVDQFFTVYFKIRDIGFQIIATIQILYSMQTRQKVICIILQFVTQLSHQGQGVT